MLRRRPAFDLFLGRSLSSSLGVVATLSFLVLLLLATGAAWWSVLTAENHEYHVVGTLEPNEIAALVTTMLLLVTCVGALAARMAARAEARAAVLTREQEQRFRVLFENGSLARWICDGLTGEVVHASDAALHAAGCASLAELAAQRRACHGDELDQHILSTLATGARRHELSRVLPDGSTRWEEVWLTPIVFEGALRVLVSVKDVSEQHRAAEALARQELEMRTLFDLLPALVWFKDTNNRHLRANRRAAEAIGRTVEEIEGRPCADVLPLEADAYYQDDLKVIESGKPRLGIVDTVTDKGGHVRWVQTDKVPYFDAQGKVAGILVLTTDISERVRIERELREEKERLAKIAATSPGVVHSFRVAPDDRMSFTYMSPRIGELYGVASEELARDAQSVISRYHPDDLARMFESVRRSRHDLTPWHEEFRYEHPKRGEIWLEASMMPEPDADGGTTWHGVLSDITARKRAEAELLRHQRLLEDVGRLARVGGWEFDAETGEGGWTEQVAQIHELPPGSRVTPEQGLTFYVGESRARIEEAVREAIAHGTPYDLELELQTATGRKRWVRTIARPVFEAGRVRKLRGALQDITDRKLAERHLSLQLTVGRRLAAGKAIEATVAEVITLVAREGGFTCGRMWCVQGQSLEACLEVAGSGDCCSTPSDGALARRALALRDVAIEGDEALVLRVACPVFHDRDVQAVVEFVASEPQPWDDARRETLVGVGRQLGLFLERRRAEEELHLLNAELERRVQERTAELQQANQELESFSYSVSHDLRAPLRAIDGFSAALLEDFGATLPSDGHHYAEVVRREAQRMGSLIDDLLTFSRLSRAPLRLQTVDTDRMVRDIVADLRAGDGCRTTFEVGALSTCHGDPVLLRQVWANLLQNAVKYSSKGPAPVVTVGERREDGELTYVVKDNGVGFDMRYAHKLFGVFQRLHSDDEYQGTGVGLSIVQRIVHRHGGRVRGEAELGRGATFSFSLGRQNSVAPPARASLPHG